MEIQMLNILRQRREELSFSWRRKVICLPFPQDISEIVAKSREVEFTSNFESDALQGVYDIAVMTLGGGGPQRRRRY